MRNYKKGARKWRTSEDAERPETTDFLAEEEKKKGKKEELLLQQRLRSSPALASSVCSREQPERNKWNSLAT
jgi:hypothetical protein